MSKKPAPADDRDDDGEEVIGIPCAKCKGTAWRVKATEPRPGVIRRRRICKKCGAKRITVETPLGRVGRLDR